MWNMAHRKNETDIAQSTMERARKRLKLSSPVATGNDYYLPGLKQFGDAFGKYHLRTDGEGTWECSCYSHYGGEFRQEKVCSHSAAVALHFNLPCQRTLPLREEPKRPTPDRPCDIAGIPDKYTAWRPYQREAVEWVLEQWTNGSKYAALDEPTGSGKSLTAIAAARLKGLKTVYCVATKQLQEQLAGDFSNAVIIWGRENYPCVRFPGTELSAADCTHRQNMPCPKIGNCPYKAQKRRALASDLAVVNYSFFLNEANHVGGFSGWPLVILDEGDLAEDELMKFVSLRLTKKQLETCQISPPEYKTKFEAWLEWASPTARKVHDYIASLETNLEPYLEQDLKPPVDVMKEILRYQRLAAKLSIFTEWVDGTWIAELDDPEKWEFKPTWVRREGHLLHQHGQKVLAMSATMLNPKDWAWGLGIDDDIAFHRGASSFPKQNRPIVPLPTADFSKKATDDETLGLMVRVVDGLLDKHKGDKGLIHTVSYKLTRELLNRSRHQGRLISHNEAGTRAEALEQLIESDVPQVLVSPSFGRGIDLFGDRARFQVIVKLPFMDLGDKQTAKRRWSGKGGGRWYTLQTVRALVQQAGRVVRSANDHGTTYILDSRFERFFKQMHKDFPPWFSEAIIW